MRGFVAVLSLAMAHGVLPWAQLAWHARARAAPRAVVALWPTAFSRASWKHAQARSRTTASLVEPSGDTHLLPTSGAHDAPVARARVLFPPRKNEETVNEMNDTNQMTNGDQLRTRSVQEAKKAMQSDMCEADTYASAGRTAV